MCSFFNDINKDPLMRHLFDGSIIVDIKHGLIDKSEQFAYLKSKYK